MSKNKPDVRNVADYLDLPALERFERVADGSPGALRELLRNLEAFLRGEKEIAGSDLSFAADALSQLTADCVWESSQVEFEKLDRSGFSFVEQVSGRGPRISEATQRRIGAAFCRAFYISKSQGKLKEGEVPKNEALCPAEVNKIERLRQYGVSRRDSIKIVQAAYPSFTCRKLDEWVRFNKITAPQPGTAAGWALQKNQRTMAAAILREKLRGQSLEAAYDIVAEGLACKLFPSLRDRLKRWADRVLDEAEERPEAHLELARKVDEAYRQGENPPRVPQDLHAQIESELAVVKSSTFLPEDAVQLLRKAVRRAASVRSSFSAHIHAGRKSGPTSSGDIPGRPEITNEF